MSERSDEHGAANRLAGESSPYLRLHAHNPVDWFPWGEEALAKARREDKPIFLSVGYSTCYWCHVMERESFSDPGVAEQMNRDFVNVKVDREERPDLDELYMLATQLLAEQGGWPNSVFLTPKLEPFFAGTYFPPADAHGRPGFPTVLRSMVHAWRERRDEVEQQAGELATAIRRHLDEIEPWREALPGRELAEQALAGLRERFDPTWGGFGQQPKFPTPSNLWLLAELAGERSEAAMMLATTLDRMARGGIFDPLAGGFHRYATDREWKVPHFEKMLYDNGLLLERYALEHARTGRPEPARVALAIAAWLEREMTSPEGALWSAIDAETGGREGAYYVWTRAELDAALGAEDAEFLAPILGYDGEPFFEGEAYVLHLARPLEVLARERRTTREALLEEIEPLRARLLEARSRRPRPATDDKILADWNGTAIAGLATAGQLLGREDLVARAARAAEFVLGTMRAADGTLLHAWRAGEGRVAAFLSDYVFLTRGLLRLYDATGQASWLDRATGLFDEQERRLGSPRGGWFNAAESDDLLIRAKEVFDGAVPAANAVAALDALELHAATGEERFLVAAERTLRAFAPIVSTHPDGARTMALALARFAEVAGEALAPESIPSKEEGKDRFQDKGKVQIQDKDKYKDKDGREGKGPSAARRVGGGGGEGGVGALGRVEVEVSAGVDERGFRAFSLVVPLRDGWHLAVEEDLPRLSGVGAELERVEWPTARPVGEAEGAPRVPGFVGKLVVRGAVRADAPRPSITLHFVACGEGRCLPPAEIEISLPG